MELFLHLSVKLVVGFIALFIMTKLIGAREVKQLTVFDFISAIVLSELVGNVLFVEQANAMHMIYAIAVWGSLIIIIDQITLKSSKARKLLDGEPDIIIEQAKINKSTLKKHNMDINELLSLLRQKDVFTVREVRLAFLEPNGSLSLIRYNAEQLAVPVIIDGNIAETALNRIGKDQMWLDAEIKRQGYQHAGQILLAEYMEGEALHIQPQPK
ncbi:DUF421 domain-containing protein [Paenibacillus xerothermodurans]|uniref:DUF421 domain-containing protein n=1 Tax=Paenibacillus xerothermodurans TaxID=1977292 RepID=A0A2W1NEW4_PAEXE|nr:DUF421 domain-containing protein [Paenibacillus xerothermodurans]PZE21581.1 DUF421 domain-containing protein [Paenibacillus xerothermodurans]